MRGNPRHPMQPLVVKDGVIRFKANTICRWLADKVDLNEISIFALNANVPVEDMEQFWQLLGYSVSGYGDLSFVRRKTVIEADNAAAAISEQLKKKKGKK